MAFRNSYGLSCIIFEIKRYICRKSRFYHIPPSFDTLAGGGDPRQNIAVTFDVEKLKWCGIRRLKNLI